MRSLLFLVFTLGVAFFSGPPEAYALVRSITFPVQGAYSYRDDFSEPRAGGAREHLGIDIAAAKMTPVVAAVDGRITFIAIPQASWGYAITITDSDGYTYRYLHLNNDTPGTDDGNGGESHAYAADLSRGSVVTRGQVIGWVGDSGNAESTVPHLHFEIRNSSRTAINPYDSLYAAAGGTHSGQFSGTPTHTVDVTPEEEEQFIATRQLQEGLVDVQVKELHTKLKALGYYTGTVTERYDAVTREAVRKFQVVEDLSPTGIADGLTQRRLEERTQSVPEPVVAPSANLEQGASGASVRSLQGRLKELGYFTGDVTGYFGTITRDALSAFQKANNISPAAGYYGPLTRKVIDSDTAVRASESAGSETPTSAVPAAPSAGTSVLSLSRDLERGSKGENVRILQKFLNGSGHPIAESGDGSSGQETTYFGLLTEKALASFQKANGITPAAGYFGAKTRAFLKTHATE